MTDKMSELDNENVEATDDGEANDIELINDEVAEMTGQSSLKIKIRSFLELFGVEKNNLILTLINDAEWDKNNKFLTFVRKSRYASMIQ